MLSYDNIAKNLTRLIEAFDLFTGGFMSLFARLVAFIKRLFRRDSQTIQMGLGQPNTDQRRDNQYSQFAAPAPEPLPPPVAPRVEPPKQVPISEPVRISSPQVTRPEPIAPKIAPPHQPMVPAPKLESQPPFVPPPMHKPEVSSIPKPEPRPVPPYLIPPPITLSPLETKPAPSKPIELPKIAPPMPPPMAAPPIPIPAPPITMPSPPPMQLPMPPNRSEARQATIMEEAISSTSPLDFPPVPGSKLGGASRFATIQPSSSPFVPSKSEPFLEPVPSAPRPIPPPPQQVMQPLAPPRPVPPPIPTPPPIITHVPEDMNLAAPAPPSIPSIPQQKPVAPPLAIQPPKPTMPTMPTMPKATTPPLAPPMPQAPPRNIASTPTSTGTSSSAPHKKYDPSGGSDQSAQRLARLLVSEIKLYNEKKIIEGRKNNNLYDLLKDTIEQSRKHFKERMGAALESMPDYFHEELVKTLCEGDASKLGTNYQK